MEAREFRIGNYHEYRIEDSMDERKEWWEVCTIDEYDFVEIGIGDSLDYRPIQLNEDWIIKLGFELTYKSKFTILYIHKTDDRFKYKFGLVQNNQYLEYYGGSIKCDYVHQLQNLYFALTGEELILKQG